MARTHARIRLDMWADDDYRDLTMGAQWLYEFLLSAPATTFAGVHPWRPGVISGHNRDTSAADIDYFAAELEVGHYVVIDRDTEECLIRSFIKHDGLMKSPNMAKALVKEHAKIGSAALRAVVVDQLKRLKRQQPELKGWDHLGTLLRKRSMTPAEAIAVLPRNPSGNPSAYGSENPSGNPSGRVSATPILPSSLPPNSPSSSSPSVTREQGVG